MFSLYQVAKPGLRFKSNMLVNLLGQWQDLDYGGESIPIGGEERERAKSTLKLKLKNKN